LVLQTCLLLNIHFILIVLEALYSEDLAYVTFSSISEPCACALETAAWAWSSGCTAHMWCFLYWTNEHIEIRNSLITNQPTDVWRRLPGCTEIASVH